MIAAADDDERLGICIDTQHLWASGVDFSTVDGADAVVDEVGQRFGLERLGCMHLNDSKVDLGANRDRHENLGDGTIGAEGLAALLGHPALNDACRRCSRCPARATARGARTSPRLATILAAGLDRRAPRRSPRPPLHESAEARLGPPPRRRRSPRGRVTRSESDTMGVDRGSRGALLGRADRAKPAPLRDRARHDAARGDPRVRDAEGGAAATVNGELGAARRPPSRR